MAATVGGGSRLHLCLSHMELGHSLQEAPVSRKNKPEIWLYGAGVQRFKATEFYSCSQNSHLMVLYVY